MDWRSAEANLFAADLCRADTGEKRESVKGWQGQRHGDSERELGRGERSGAGGRVGQKPEVTCSWLKDMVVSLMAS